MRRAQTWARTLFAVLLSLSLVVWSSMPSVAHIPTVIETIQDHLEMIADHGHSHGFEEDLYWALHGHGHDAADHDHSQVFLIVGPKAEPVVNPGEIWKLVAYTNKQSRTFRIERPPRA